MRSLQRYRVSRGSIGRRVAKGGGGGRATLAPLLRSGRGVGVRVSQVAAESRTLTRRCAPPSPAAQERGCARGYRENVHPGFSPSPAKRKRGWGAGVSGCRDKPSPHQIGRASCRERGGQAV